MPRNVVNDTILLIESPMQLFTETTCLLYHCKYVTMNYCIDSCCISLINFTKVTTLSDALVFHADL